MKHTHTQPFNGRWSGTTRVGRYKKKYSPTHTHPDQQTSYINFLHLLRSIASSVFSLRAWQSSLTTSLQVLFGLGPSTSYSMYFFTQSLSSDKWNFTNIFCSTSTHVALPTSSVFFIVLSTQQTSLEIVQNDLKKMMQDSQQLTKQ